MEIVTRKSLILMRTLLILLFVFVIVIINICLIDRVRANSNINFETFIFNPAIVFNDTAAEGKTAYINYRKLNEISMSDIFNFLEENGLASDLITPELTYGRNDKRASNTNNILNILESNGNFSVIPKLNLYRLDDYLKVTTNVNNKEINDFKGFLNKLSVENTSLVEFLDDEVKLPDGIVPGAEISIEVILKKIIDEKGKLVDVFFGGLNQYVFDWAWFKIVDTINGQRKIVKTITARDADGMLEYAKYAFDPKSPYKMFLFYKFDSKGNLVKLDSYDKVEQVIFRNYLGENKFKYVPTLNANTSICKKIVQGFDLLVNDKLKGVNYISIALISNRQQNSIDDYAFVVFIQDKSFFRFWGKIKETFIPNDYFPYDTNSGTGFTYTANYIPLYGKSNYGEMNDSSVYNVFKDYGKYSDVTITEKIYDIYTSFMNAISGKKYSVITINDIYSQNKGNLEQNKELSNNLNNNFKSDYEDLNKLYLKLYFIKKFNQLAIITSSLNDQWADDSDIKALLSNKRYYNNLEGLMSSIKIGYVGKSGWVSAKNLNKVIVKFGNGQYFTVRDAMFVFFMYNGYLNDEFFDELFKLFDINKKGDISSIKSQIDSMFNKLTYLFIMDYINKQKSKDLNLNKKLLYWEDLLNMLKGDYKEHDKVVNDKSLSEFIITFARYLSDKSTVALVFRNGVKYNTLNLPVYSSGKEISPEKPIYSYRMLSFSINHSLSSVNVRVIYETTNNKKIGEIIKPQQGYFTLYPIGYMVPNKGRVVDYEIIGNVSSTLKLNCTLSFADLGPVDMSKLEYDKMARSYIKFLALKLASGIIGDNSKDQYSAVIKKISSIESKINELTNKTKKIDVNYYKGIANIIDNELKGCEGVSILVPVELLINTNPNSGIFTGKYDYVKMNIYFKDLRISNSNYIEDYTAVIEANNQAKFSLVNTINSTFDDKILKEKLGDKVKNNQFMEKFRINTVNKVIYKISNFGLCVNSNFAQVLFYGIMNPSSGLITSDFTEDGEKLLQNLFGVHKISSSNSSNNEVFQGIGGIEKVISDTTYRLSRFLWLEEKYGDNIKDIKFKRQSTVINLGSAMNITSNNLIKLDSTNSTISVNVINTSPLYLYDYDRLTSIPIYDWFDVFDIPIRVIASVNLQAVPAITKNVESESSLKEGRVITPYDSELKIKNRKGYIDLKRFTTIYLTGINVSDKFSGIKKPFYIDNNGVIHVKAGYYFDVNTQLKFDIISYEDNDSDIRSQFSNIINNSFVAALYSNMKKTFEEKTNLVNKNGSLADNWDFEDKFTSSVISGFSQLNPKAEKFNDLSNSIDDIIEGKSVTLYKIAPMDVLAQIESDKILTSFYKNYIMESSLDGIVKPFSSLKFSINLSNDKEFSDFINTVQSSGLIVVGTITVKLVYVDDSDKISTYFDIDNENNISLYFLGGNNAILNKDDGSIKGFTAEKIYKRSGLDFSSISTYIREIKAKSSSFIKNSIKSIKVSTMGKTGGSNIMDFRNDIIYTNVNRPNEAIYKEHLLWDTVEWIPPSSYTDPITGTTITIPGYWHYSGYHPYYIKILKVTIWFTLPYNKSDPFYRSYYDPTFSPKLKFSDNKMLESTRRVFISPNEPDGDYYLKIKGSYLDPVSKKVIEFESKNSILKIHIDGVNYDDITKSRLFRNEEIN